MPGSGAATSSKPEPARAAVKAPAGPRAFGPVNWRGLAALYRPQNFLHSLYVDVRGLGVGAALLDYVAAQCCGPLSLKVQEPNARARAFYAREGFVCIEHGRDADSDVAWLRLVRET